MIKLSTSAYYHDPKTTRVEREERDADLRGQIEQVRAAFPRAGYRMLIHHLKKRGITVGETRLRRVLRESGLQIRPKRKFVKTTDSNHGHKVYPNHLPQMTINGPDQVWASDITYIRIENGFVYLAVVLDLYLRKVIGWAISKKIDGDLTVDALNLAIARRNPPKGVIHHSDRGVQYLCQKYVGILKASGFHISCSAKGNPYDNAWVESFMKTLKYEEVYMMNYETYLDVIENLPNFIEEVYNKKRPHSSLGYLSPEEFEESLKEEYNKAERPTFTL